MQEAVAPGSFHDDEVGVDPTRYRNDRPGRRTWSSRGDVDLVFDALALINLRSVA
jgi:hypothetical protein